MHTVHQVTSYGDRDGDRDVDAVDKVRPGTGCTGTVSGACRILDLDFDGDYDSADATLFDALPQGNAQNPGRTASSLGNTDKVQVFDAARVSASVRHDARGNDNAPGGTRTHDFRIRNPMPGSITDDTTSTYEHTDSARSLGASNRNEKPPTDPDLETIIGVWNDLPEHARATIKAIVEASTTTGTVEGERSRGRKRARKG